MGRSIKEERKSKVFSCPGRAQRERGGEPRFETESRAGGRSRSSTTTNTGGAQTRRRDASMAATKKSVLAHRHGRVHDLALGEPLTIFLSMS
ncbi:hypothetical protein BHE74_00055113 [Ensete ventricosum]|nr:hypothetical protein GW17_00034473 [Ensete ventricosum]RWW39547.1 hypothetical protein BHE74_00055113 [Ensete ventricosum]RZS25896.1 hypothetical protein BHM03_00059156 [Ensete ventricosum]